MTQVLFDPVSDQSCSSAVCRAKFCRCFMLAWLLGAVPALLAANETQIILEDAQMTVSEADTAVLPFTIRREGDMVGGVRLWVETAEGGANPATPGEDYTPVPAGTEIVLHPEQSGVTIDVEVFGSPAGTADRTLLLDLIEARAFDPQPRFSPTARNYPVLGMFPSSLAVADLNGNGRLDIVTGNDLGTTVSVLLSDSEGGFDTATTYSVDPGSPTLHVVHVAVGDVTGNGHPDIVAGGFDAHAIRVFPGDGTGTFADPVHIALPGVDLSFPTAIAVADLNHSGHMDIATTFGEPQAPNVSILFGEGKGGFAPVEVIPVDENPHTMTLTDVTGSGHLDIVLGNSTDITILVGDGGGGFAAPVSFPAFSAGSGVGRVSSVAAIDVTGNGELDLITANRHSDNPFSPVFTHGSVSVLAGDGAGGFGDAVQLELRPGPVISAVSADITGNGHPDIVFIRGDAHDDDSGDQISSDSVNLMHGVGGGDFEPPIKLYSTGAAPGAVVIADVTGDRVQDVITANAVGSSVSVLPGSGDGNFGFPGNTEIAGRPYAVVAEDLNGNGLEDMVTANFRADSISVLISDGTGGFVIEPHELPSGSSPTWVAVGDVNDDQIPDLITANFLGDSVSVLLGDGAGGFAEAVNFDAGLAPYRVALGDVNGNGHLDIVTANVSFQDDGISLLLGDGTGHFSEPIEFEVGPGDFFNHSPRWVTLADVTGNGNLDILTANSQVDNVSILAGDGDGGFTHAAYLETGASPVVVESGDVTGEGHLDLVVLNHRSQSVSVFYGDGKGEFSDAHEFPLFDGSPTGMPCEMGGQPELKICPWAWGMILVDVTGDGYLDIVTANTGNDTVSVLANDGAGSFTVFAVFDTGAEPRSVAVADVTGDGNQDVIAAISGNSFISVLTNELSRVVPTNTRAIGTIIYGAGDDAIFIDRFEQDMP